MQRREMITFKSHKNEPCKFCRESAKAKIRNIKIKYEYENPEAYGFPEVVHWQEEYETSFCPMCGRVINDSKMAATVEDGRR